MTIRPLPLLSLLALAACAPATPAGSAPSSSDLAAVRSVGDRYQALHNADDAAGVAALHAQDAVVVGANSRLVGRDAVLRMLTNSVPTTSDFTLTDRRTTVSGDQGIDQGVASMVVTDKAGKRTRLSGDYVNVIARQPDGSWQIRTLISSNYKYAPVQ